MHKTNRRLKKNRIISAINIKRSSTIVSQIFLKTIHEIRRQYQKNEN